MQADQISRAAFLYSSSCSSKRGTITSFLRALFRCFWQLWKGEFQTFFIFFWHFSGKELQIQVFFITPLPLISSPSDSSVWGTNTSGSYSLSRQLIIFSISVRWSIQKILSRQVLSAGSSQRGSSSIISYFLTENRSSSLGKFKQKSKLMFVQKKRLYFMKKQSKHQYGFQLIS